MTDDLMSDTLLTTPEMAIAPAVTPELAPALAPVDEDRLFSILGVHITDVSRPRAIALLTQLLDDYKGRSHAVYFVNAHTLNLAAGDESFRRVLNSADRVFGDGTGVRWAARLKNVRLRDNLCGTDLVPQWMQANSRRGLRYFMLGGDETIIAAAAAHAEKHIAGWSLVGRHHGYVQNPADALAVVRQINAAQPDALLVGMGNPLQERWIDAYRRALHVPLCLGVGGLFHYWAGDLRRAPRWLRRCGAEWLGILLQQPHKWRRYVLGNPLYLWRICRETLAGR